MSVAQALLARKQYAQARVELDRALGRSESLGLRLLQARSHYLLGSALAATGGAADARRHYRDALRLFEEIRKDDRSADIVKRADLSTAYSESARLAVGQ